MENIIILLMVFSESNRSLISVFSDLLSIVNVKYASLVLPFLFREVKETNASHILYQLLLISATSPFNLKLARKTSYRSYMKTL